MTSTKPLPHQQQDYVKLSYTHKQAAKILAQQQHASHACKITWIARCPKIHKKKKTADDPLAGVFFPPLPQNVTPTLHKQAVQQAYYDVGVSKKLKACFPSIFTPTLLQKASIFLSRTSPGLCRVLPMEMVSGTTL